MNESPLPITALGSWTIATAVISYGVGWWLGWIEFLAIAIGCAIVLLIAIPFVVGGHALELERELSSDRVKVGDDAESRLIVRNASRRRSAPRVIDDSIDGRAYTLPVRALGPADWEPLKLPLPTDKRGIVKLGPAVIGKTDPLGLLRRDLGRTPPAELRVHPYHRQLEPIRSGYVKDLEGPTYDSSPAGDVAFHAIRKYEPGDDIRRIHWLSTARVGDLMVKHYVDNRRPYLGVLVDTDPDALSGPSFEVALQIAASHVVSAFADERALAAWVGSQEILSDATPGSRNTALDRFCVSQLAAGAVDPVPNYRRLRATDPDVSALIFVTGARPADELLALTSEASQNGGVVVVRVVSAATPPISLPDARVIDCGSLNDFMALWAAVVR